uniref:Uncharacterized protein n=1 Tax=viral metagenome TaxID=1070528 RepID=A0A6H1ZAU2_9ZZZZ
MNELVPFDDVQSSIEKFEAGVDSLLERALAEKNPDLAINGANALAGLERITGRSLARILYFLREHWDEFEAGEDYYNYVSNKLKFVKATVDRYCQVHEMLEHFVPPKYLDAIKGKPVRSLFKMASLTAQGYSVDYYDWETLAKMDDRDIEIQVKKIKNNPPRANALVIYITATGEIQCRVNGDDETIDSVGELYVNNQNPHVQRSIERITRCSGLRNV